MPRHIIFKCEQTGLNVQHRLERENAPADEYEVVQCPACSGSHLINVRTGKLAGERQ